MHRVLLTDSDLIVLYGLEHNELGHAILNFIRDNGVEITNEYEMHYYFYQTYLQSRPRPLSDDRIFLISRALEEGTTKYTLAYYEGNAYAIRLSEELKDVLGD